MMVVTYLTVDQDLLRVDLNKIIKRYGDNSKIRDKKTKFKCSKCGEKDFDIKIIYRGLMFLRLWGLMWELKR